MSEIEPKPTNIPKPDNDDLYGGGSIFSSEISDFAPLKTSPLKRNTLILTKQVMRSLKKLQSK